MSRRCENTEKTSLVNSVVRLPTSTKIRIGISPHSQQCGLVQGSQHGSSWPDQWYDKSERSYWIYWSMLSHPQKSCHWNLVRALRCWVWLSLVFEWWHKLGTTCRTQPVAIQAWHPVAAALRWTVADWDDTNFGVQLFNIDCSSWECPEGGAMGFCRGWFPLDLRSQKVPWCFCIRFPSRGVIGWLDGGISRNFSFVCLRLHLVGITSIYPRCYRHRRARLSLAASRF